MSPYLTDCTAALQQEASYLTDASATTGLWVDATGVLFLEFHPKGVNRLCLNLFNDQKLKI